MTIRIKLDSNILNAKHKTSILSPEEISDHIIVKKIEEGKYSFFLPFRVNIIHSIRNELVYELEIVNDNNRQRISPVNPNLLSPTTKQLDKYSLLPGQINFNIDDTNKRIAKRNTNREASIESVTKTLSFDKSSKKGSLKKQFNRKFSEKNKKLSRSLMINKNREANKSIIQNINDGDHVIRNVILFNKTKTIKKRRIDYTKKMTNSVVKKIKKSKNPNEAKKFLSSDSKIFFGKPNNPGIDQSSLVFYPLPNVGKDTMSKGGEKTLNINNTDEILTGGGSDKSKASSKNIKNRFLNQYQKRLDPAVLFEGVPTHRSALNVKRGTLPKIGIKRTGKKGKGLIFKNLNITKSLRENYVDNNLILANNIIGNNSVINHGVGKKGTFEIRRPTKRESLPFAYIKKVVKDYELLYFKYELEKNHISSNQSVNMQLNVYNKKGLKIADKLFSIMPQNIISEQTAIPDAMPTLNIAKDKNKNFLTVEVMNSSNSIMKYKLYRKFIDSSRSANNPSMFVQIDQDVVKKKGVVRKRISQVTNSDCLFRLTCQIQGDTSTAAYSNFSNEILILKNENDIKKDVMINTRIANKIANSRPGIEITVSNIPPDVVELKMLRRNTSLCKSIDSRNRMQKMEYVKDTKDVTKIQKYTVRNDSEIIFFDNQVKDNNSYEYQAEMILSRGTKKRSNLRAREEFIDRDNTVDTANFAKLLKDAFVTPKDVFFNNKNNNIVTTTIPKKGKVDYFKFETGRTQSGMIISKLTNRSNKGLYAKELEEIKDTTNIITGVNLVLKNKTNGDAFEVCDLNSGDSLATFINQVKSNKKLSMLDFCDYDLIVKGYEISPQEAIEKLTKLVKSTEDNQMLGGKINKNSAKKRAIMTKLSKNKAKKGIATASKAIPKKRSKFFQKRSLKRGTISPGVGPEATISKGKTLRGSPNIISKEFTGDISIVSLRDKFSNTCAMSAANSYVSPDHNVVITFNMNASNIKLIDFIIITAKKDGDYYPVGSAHIGNENTKTISYLDYTNVDYLGHIKYYGQAVYLSGNMSARYEIGEALLVKKFNEANI